MSVGDTRARAKLMQAPGAPRLTYLNWRAWMVAALAVTLAVTVMVEYQLVS